MLEQSSQTAAEPDASDFLAPIESRKSRRTLISVVAALTVLAMVGVTVISILIWTSSDEPAPARAPRDRVAAAQEPGPGSPAASQTTAAQITDATEQYVAAVNAGIAADYLATLCSPMRNQLSGITDTAAADPKMAVRAVTDVVVEGDIATATVSVSPEGSTSATPRTDTLRFLDEDGWKFCGQIQ